MLNQMVLHRQEIVCTMCISNNFTVLKQMIDPSLQSIALNVLEI